MKWDSGVSAALFIDINNSIKKKKDYFLSFINLLIVLFALSADQ